ncbi:hypothetical protein BJ875DRAFT_488630 [Amylocarpus encephaloides]|uniref:Nucleoporin Pom152 n=1 Tax=Amylocarpus encephaloides TaxID=45428 RepID=A0A9P7Y9P8_9HELO|nr:hypothetical protein BJ875DRAFT_488630 [Amylocarpus encephaloides]
MNATPRLRSAFPSTPSSGGRGVNQNANSGDSGGNGGAGGQQSSLLPGVPQEQKATMSPLSAPRVPVTLIDAPSQRMYTLAVYGLLSAWKLYDWWTLVEAETQSALLFVKWIFIDFVFLFGVPMLRIPWLEWSNATTSLAYVSHALATGMLMFRIPIPIEGWALLLAKTLYDKEMSISENSVSPARILHNASHIMGKQIINILPEGSVVMNPENLPLCLGNGHSTVTIPLQFNQTRPQHIQLLRIDLDTNANETVTLSSKEMKHSLQLEDGVLVINYVAKKTGLYRLHKVIDRTKLEVQRRMSDTLVVACPKGSIQSSVPNKCLGDLSNLTMQIQGTPPLHVVYSRFADEKRSIHRFQSIQPENFESPLLGGSASGTLILMGNQDVSWARASQINVPLNESMIHSGRWVYSIDEIRDASGNIVTYTYEADDGEHRHPKDAHLEQELTVHARPVVQLDGCDSRKPLLVASGKTTALPVMYTLPGRTPDDTSHTLNWKFSPLHTLTKGGDHGYEIAEEEFSARTAYHTPVIRDSGLYTLTGVKSQYCDGEVKEPASCLLVNPPEPQLSITSENINDKCAGMPIGLLVDLDLIGTPPFVVRYDVTTRTGTSSESLNVPGLRHQLQLKPQNAGHFKYRFTSVDDSVYKAHSLAGNGLTLEQDVKPPASASLRIPPETIDACIEEPVEMKVDLFGEKPFILEYELVHNGKRNRFKIPNIDTDIYKIQTDPLVNGGEYSLALTSIQDKSGCKIFLTSDVKFTVRRQRPKVSFGKIDGKRKTTVVEGQQVKLPLRLTGRPPWTVSYRCLNDSLVNLIIKTARSTNDHIDVSQQGVYEIMDISDDQCPGTVETKASTFEIDWVSRPRIKLADTAVLLPDDHKWLKREVCEGDIDAVEVHLIGTSPYHVKYQVRHKPETGSASIINKEFEAALGLATISMETSKAGKYEYKFSELSDALYDHDSKRFTPLVVEQIVNRKPSAHFVKPGQSYKYCKAELAGNEIIPIRLEGMPPFSLEVDIKHQSSSRPLTVKVANIESNRYDFIIPQPSLNLGMQHVSVRKVRDSRGCQQKTEYGAPHVQVQVYDVPTIHPTEARVDYCVGERIAYTLSGAAPFEISYSFEGVKRKAKSSATTFRRIAEKPGNFTITGVSDKASECKAITKISKIIHEMPSVRISKGRLVEVDIHEGGEAEILFEFWGTPPFEFTYTRSTNSRKGQKSQVLETRREVSHEYRMTIQSSQEGTYEVVAIKDKFCSFSTQKAETGGGQKLLQF